jgi:hypothetical protein
MTYEQFTGAMQTLKHAKNYLRAQRGLGNVQASIERNRAINLMNDAEFGLTGEFANQMVASPKAKVIAYSADLDIRNTKFLAPGLGLKYLECLSAPEAGVLIAKCWHREFPKDAAIVVEF